MYLIWGTRLAGKVDEVPNVCWVATKVFHLFFVPVIPLGTRIVLAETLKGGSPGAFTNNSLFAYASWKGASYRTIRTAFSFKSYIAAYLVPTLWGVAIVLAIDAPLLGAFVGLECNLDTGGVFGCITGGILFSIILAIPAVLSWRLAKHLSTRRGWGLATEKRERQLTSIVDSMRQAEA